ncbi:MAG TPA: hypothetical protein VGS19_24630 [Streptosporangiaceae bacterium]|nr:hypothetical protein [Streptosporangiaceae bacterium]
MDNPVMAPGGTPDETFRVACARLAASVAGGREVTDAARQVAVALAAIERDYPGWRCWRASISPLYYARRPDVIPPLVVRSASAEGLRGEVEAAERDHGQVRR